MFVIFIFVFEKCRSSFSWGLPFGPFWSAKYLNFGGESCEIRILSCSIQETYKFRKVKKNRFYFFNRVENQIFLISWSNIQRGLIRFPWKLWFCCQLWACIFRSNHSQKFWKIALLKRALKNYRNEV